MTKNNNFLELLRSMECCEPDRESATKSAAFADHNAQRHTHVVRSLRKADKNPFYLDTKIVKMTTNR